MSERHSIADARSNLPRLVREAEGGKAVELTRHGEPVAVLVGHREFQRLTGRVASFVDAYAGFCDKVDLEALDFDPDELFGGARDRSRGRDVRL